MWKLEQMHLKCREAMFSQWLLHTVSVFSSEPASRFAATVVLKAFCGIYFIDSLSQIFSLSTSQVCFYPCRAFDLLPECSLACPGRVRPGWPLTIFSGEHFISTFYCCFFFTPNDTLAASDSSFDPNQ